MKKAFIFDLDGTLLNSMSVWENIGADYLSSKGIVSIPSNIKEILKPLSLLDAANYFISEFGIALSPQQICQEINSTIEGKYKFEIELKDGVLDFLEGNSDHKMCVATATDKNLSESVLKRLGLFKCFDFIITSAEVGNSKQNPDIFLQAAERLGEAVENCIVFEDALHAIKTAKLAGFNTVGVYEKYFENEMDEIKKYADQFVCSLNEVRL